MKKPTLFILLFIFIILAFLTTACSGPAAGQSVPAPTQEGSTSDQPEPAPAKGSPTLDQTPPSFQELSDDQGAVTVSVIPLNLENPGETLDFKVSLETHSVDLSMDVAALATLSTDSGHSVQAVQWDAPRGGHHVQGTLSFPVTAENAPTPGTRQGRALGMSLLDGAAQVTLTIQDLDAPERVFTWEINQ